jgi:hypothetical protein
MRNRTLLRTRKDGAKQNNLDFALGLGKKDRQWLGPVHNKARDRVDPAIEYVSTLLPLAVLLRALFAGAKR